MFKIPAASRAPGAVSVRRAAVFFVALAAAWSLAGCGGGEDTVAFDIGVVVNGQAVSGVQIVPGSPQDIAITAGQSIELDASEPVVWSLQVGDSTVTGSGTTVYYGNVAITQTAVSDSRIVVNTAATAPFAGSVPITFVATSTIDSAQVATVNVLISD